MLSDSPCPSTYPSALELSLYLCLPALECQLYISPLHAKVSAQDCFVNAQRNDKMDKHCHMENSIHPSVTENMPVGVGSCSELITIS